MALLDDRPLLNFMKSLLNIERFPKGIQRMFSVMAANVATGEEEVFDNSNTAFEDVA